MNLSGSSTVTVTATAAGKVTLANPSASLLTVTGDTIAGVMNNTSPLSLTTTTTMPGISVNLTGSLPYLMLRGDVRTNIAGLGVYNGAVVMGRELDHYKATIDSRTATSVLAANSEKTGNAERQSRFAAFFAPVSSESLVDSKWAYFPPETNPTIIDR